MPEPKPKGGLSPRRSAVRTVSDPRTKAELAAGHIEDALRAAGLWHVLEKNPDQLAGDAGKVLEIVRRAGKGSAEAESLFYERWTRRAARAADPGRRHFAEAVEMGLQHAERSVEEVRAALSFGASSPEDLPYEAWKRLSAFMEGAGDWGIPKEPSADLERRVMALEAENARLRAREPGTDPELAALEAEVAAMLAAGKPPESYAERADRKEGPREFLARVYGKYLGKGREAIYLHEIRRLDPKFAKSLVVACNTAGQSASEFVPTKRDKTDRLLERAGATAVTLARALHAKSIRKKN